jgi:dehydrogenase/reductase SDR family member 12
VTDRSLPRLVDAALEATIVLSFSRIGSAVRSRLEAWPQPRTARPRRVLVTGANSGLGYATARGLLRGGARVHLLVRSQAKGEQTLARLAAEFSEAPAASFGVADLGDLGSVRDFAAELLADDEPLDTVVHNAGAMFPTAALTVDGLERTYQLHVVAPFLLTALLLPKLTAAAPAQVITVTSGGMYSQRLDVDELTTPTRYRPAAAYARAKRAQVESTASWSHRLAGRGVAFHTAHPGWALTPGVEASLPRFRALTGPVLRDPDAGADTVVWLALREDTGRDGLLWHDRRPRATHRVPWTVARTAERDRLWDRLVTDAGIDPLA